MSTVGNKFAIFQYQFTSPVYWTSSVLLNSRNCQRKSQSICIGDRLSNTQAGELSLATVYRSQQLYTAEQSLNCKKKWGNAIPLTFSSFPSFSFPFFSSPPLPRSGPWKAAIGVWGSSVISPQWGPGRSPGRTHFGVFWAWKSHLAATFFLQTS